MDMEIQSLKLTAQTLEREMIDHGWMHIETGEKIKNLKPENQKLQKDENTMKLPPNVNAEKALLELFSAARNGDLETVKRSLRSGANINSKDSILWTPLHWASENGH